MARYPTEHKSKTRAHLLEVARSEFRKRGFEATSIDRLMRAAGLTRGGFYAHFKSKEALVKEVLKQEPGLMRQLRDLQPGTAGREAAADHLDAYLEPAKRHELIQCPLVAHPLDALRGGDERKALYSEQVEALTHKLAALLDGDEEEATLITVMAVGAAILSSSAAKAADADAIQELCRSEIRRRLTGG